MRGKMCKKKMVTILKSNFWREINVPHFDTSFMILSGLKIVTLYLFDNFNPLAADIKYKKEARQREQFDQSLLQGQQNFIW